MTTQPAASAPAATLSAATSSLASSSPSSGAVGVPKLQVVNTRNPQVIRLAAIGVVLLVAIALIGILSGLKSTKSASNELPAELTGNPSQSPFVSSGSGETGSLGTPAFAPGSTTLAPAQPSPASTGLTPLPLDRGLLDSSSSLSDRRPPYSPPPPLSPPLSPPISSLPSAAASSATTSTGKVYVVQSGDTLWAIAQKVYGDGSQYKQLVKDNPGVAVGKLQAGTKLKLSAAAATAGTSSTAKVPASGSQVKGKTWVVKEGQTLRSIAKREYGNPGLWEVIYKANKSRIKSPSELPVGVTLIIPPKP